MHTSSFPTEMLKILRSTNIQASALIFVILLICSLTLLHIHGDNDAVFFNPILKEVADKTRRSISHHQSKLSPSRYFFDRVNGAVRLAFHKRSIQEWESDVQDNDYVELSTEDLSKAAFASDDLPVDNDLRNEASQVKSIEEVILLNVTTLKEEWDGRFRFHKERRFLNRNKMLSPCLQDLHPINNPMLQDPDMPLYNQTN